jgi:hypothetical protein
MTWFFKKEIVTDKDESFKIKTTPIIEQIPKKESYLSFYIDLEVLHPTNENITQLIKNLNLGFNLPKNCEVTDSNIRRIEVHNEKNF